MSRISLVEQYNNKDVITQVYDVKDKLQTSLDNLDEALEVAENAIEAANTATQAADNAVSLVNQVSTRTEVLEGYVGSPSDTRSPEGSVYARIAENVADISDTNNAVSNLVSVVADNSADIAGMKPTVDNLPINYQERSEKDRINGYAGLTTTGKIATSEIDTGVNLNQILQAGAQLNTGEFLYIGPGGTIRSRIIGEGVEYVGNYASLAALEAYPDPQNGDFATVYGTASDDGFYMYDGTTWNKSALFDATDYELIANKVTGISSASSNSQYPSAKAVYDYCAANDIATMVLSQTTGANGITVTAMIQNVNASTITTTSLLIPTTDTPTASSNVPITAGGVKTAVDTVNANITSAVSGKQNTLVSTTVTLAVANWSSSSQTITGIAGLTADSIVWVTPAPASHDEYTESSIRATAQGSGSLTFACTDTPTNDLVVNVVIA